VEAETPLLVPIPEACRLLGGLSRPKLYLMVRSGELVKRKIGSRAFITRRSIEALAEGEDSDADRGGV
jgi:Helix-turn-helix domain